MVRPRGPGPPSVAPRLLQVLLLLVATRFVVPETNKQYHMKTLCKSHFLQQLYRKIDGAVLSSQNERNLDCIITFQTHSILQRFMLRFDLLQLDCNDHLLIYDGAHAVGNYKSDLSCRNTKVTVGAIYTRTNFVTLKYVTDNWGTEANGFRLVITAFKDKKHACEDFRCTREFCIDKDLVCDEVNHCGDGSDEAGAALCEPNEFGTVLGMSPLVLVAASVSGLLVLLGGAVLLGLCICRRHPAAAAANATPAAAPATPPSHLPYFHVDLLADQKLRYCSATDMAVGGRRQGGGCVPEPNYEIKTGKLASPCGLDARVHSATAAAPVQLRAGHSAHPQQLPGKVAGSDSDLSSGQKDEWFV